MTYHKINQSNNNNIFAFCFDGNSHQKRSTKQQKFQTKVKVANKVPPSLCCRTDTEEIPLIQITYIQWRLMGKKMEMLRYPPVYKLYGIFL